MGQSVLKVLRVCSSKDLPESSARLSNYLYFVYDKMELYFYHSYYSDPFCIVETMPTANLVENMLYITTTGDVKTYIDYKTVDIGSIEKDTSGNPDSAQLQLLLTAGTTYFMNAESRYLNLQTRVLELPYQNGSYQLSINLASQLKINNNTIIKFNEETNQFEVQGDFVVPEGMTRIDQYKPRPTESVTTNITDKVMYCNINISDQPNNCIKVYGNGLYIDVNDKISQSEFDNVLYAYEAYRALIDSYIQELKTAVLKATDAVSSETIGAMVDAALVKYESTIQEMLANYDTLSTKIDTINTEVTTGTDSKIESAKDDIKNYVNQVDKAWQAFSQDDIQNRIYYSDSEMNAQTQVLDAFRTAVLVLRSVDGYTYTIVTAIPASPDANTVYAIATTDGYNLYLGSNSTVIWKTVTFRIYDVVTALPTTGVADTYYIIADTTANTYTFYEYVDSAFKVIDVCKLMTSASTTTITSSYPTTIDSSVNSYGLTTSEQEVQNDIMTKYQTTMVTMKKYLEFTDTNSLYETGSTGYLYFVIDATNSIYEVYIWTGTAYELSYTYKNGALVYYTTGSTVVTSNS